MPQYANEEELKKFRVQKGKAFPKAFLVSLFSDLQVFLVLSGSTVTEQVIVCTHTYTDVL